MLATARESRRARKHGPDGHLQTRLLQRRMWTVAWNVHSSETKAVASLRLVSLGAATNGVTYFSPQKNRRPFFSQRPLQRAKWWPFLAVVSSPLPSSHVGCQPGRSAPPPSDATGQKVVLEPGAGVRVTVNKTFLLGSFRFLDWSPIVSYVIDVVE